MTLKKSETKEVPTSSKRDKKRQPFLAWTGTLIVTGVLILIIYAFIGSSTFADQPRLPLLVSLALALWPALFAGHTFLTPSSLKTKLVSAFLLVSLLPVGVLSLLDQRMTFQALSANSRQAMLGAASRSSATVDNFISANLATVRTEAMIPQFVNLLQLPPSQRPNSTEEQDAMNILISLKRRDQTNITSIALLDMDGKSVADTFGTDLGADESDHIYFRQPMNTGLPYVSSVELAGVFRQPSIYFSCPVRNTAGQMVGLLRVRYNASVLQKLISSENDTSDSDFSAMLFDESGRRLADSKHPNLAFSPDHSQQQNTNTQGVILYQSEGIFGLQSPAFFHAMLHGPEAGPTLNVKIALRSIPWTLVLAYSEQTILTKVKEQSINAIILVLAVTLAVVVSAVFITRKITDPLLRLTQAAHSISQGRENVTVPQESHDEIGELASSFNTMSQSLFLSRQRLTESSERLKSLLDTLPDAVFVHNNFGAILDVNRSFQTMFGYEVSQASTISLEELSGQGLTQQDAVDRIEQAIENGSSEFEWTARHKDGHEIPIYVRLRRLDLPEGMRIMAVSSDITDRKNAEEAMLRAQEELESKVTERTRELQMANAELRQLDELKSAFLSSASHELRTPLTSVLGFAKLVGKNFQKNFLPLASNDNHLLKRGKKLLDNLQVIEAEGDRLARLLNELLDLNKIESGKIEWHDEQIDLSKELGLAVKTMASEFRANPAVKITLDADPATPSIIADRDRIRQVFLNLLSNAVKFTRKGFIRITLTPLPDGGAEARFQDSGSGIPATELEKIFDKFYQVQASRPNLAKTKGTGLGLSICQQIVEHYRGRIWAESEQGQGATFIVQFPK